YIDVGVDRFGSWYWVLCRRACRQGLKQCCPQFSHVIASVDPSCLTEVPAVPVREHPSDRFARAVGAITEQRLHQALLDWWSGQTVEQSAIRQGLSLRTINRLRQQGRRLLRQIWLRDD